MKNSPIKTKALAPSFKVGDRIIDYVNKMSGTIVRQEMTYVLFRSDNGLHYEISNEELSYQFVLEEVYESPLYKALTEEK